MKRFLQQGSRDAFAALSVPNFRAYAAGQGLSMIGTWMQVTAQAWLVLTLTHSSTALGAVIAAQTLPVLLFGAYGGLVADRVDKRRLMIALQCLMGLQAVVLSVLTLTGAVRLWHVVTLAALLGLTNAFENPARQAFMLELVGIGQLRNAVSLNSVMVNAARAIGPAVAGILIATTGEAACFTINALSFAAVVFALLRMDVTQLRPSQPAGRLPGQLRAGLRYARGVPDIAIPLVMMTLVGTLAYEFQVSLPVMARQGLHRGAEAYGLMTAMMGLGAVAGGLVVAARGRTGLRPLAIASASFGAVITIAALAPTLPVELLALVAVGYASVAFMATGNSTIQLAADPSMRGRMMALWFIAFQGTTPIGGPLIGWIAASAGARVGLGVGAISCLAAAAICLAVRRHQGATPRSGHAFGTN